MGCAVRARCRHSAVHRRRDRRSDRGGGDLRWSAAGRPHRSGRAVSRQGPRDADHVRERRGLHVRRRARRPQRHRPRRAAGGCELRRGDVHRARPADIFRRADGAAHDHRRSRARRRTPRHALERAALAFAGGLFAIALVLVLWRAHAHLPERRAIARVYRALAAWVRDPNADDRRPILEAQTAARQALDASVGSTAVPSPSVEAFRVLVDEADRTYLDLVSLRIARQRLEPVDSVCVGARRRRRPRRRGGGARRRRASARICALGR